MDNPRPEKVAVVDEVRARLDAADAAILTEYRGPHRRRAGRACAPALRAAGGDYKVYKNTLVKLAIDRRPRTRRWRRCSRGRRRSPSSRARSARRPRPCATTPGPTRAWWSRGACTARASCPRRTSAPWPTCRRATCSWPSWPGPSPPRSSSSPASSRRCPATSPTGCRPCSTSGVVPRRRARAAAQPETAAPSRRQPAPRPHAVEAAPEAEASAEAPGEAPAEAPAEAQVEAAPTRRQPWRRPVPPSSQLNSPPSSRRAARGRSPRPRPRHSPPRTTTPESADPAEG